ncbi:MAG: TIR domain-containing protein [archaeon]|nr:TIR domain-containing protein [archaeon]
MKKIFISHALIDKPIVKSFIDDVLVGALAVKVSEIFCTSEDGMKIESGEDWRDSISNALKKSKITILIITPNYKESEVCMCEMGASWVTSSKIIPFIVDPITYSTVGVIQEPKQIEKLLDGKSLDRLKDVIQENLEIESKEIKSDRWTVKKMEFLQKTKAYLKKNPFKQPLDRLEFENLIKDKDDLENTVQALLEEKSELEDYIKDLKKAKDTSEVKKIEKKYKKIDSFDEFCDLCKKVTKPLSELSSIIIGIIFIDYSGKDIQINHIEWGEDLDDALSRDYITEEGYADWDTTKLMRGIQRRLGDLNQFIDDHEEDEDFIENYEENYDAPLSMSNLEFWEEAFDSGVSLS